MIDKDDGTLRGDKIKTQELPGYGRVEDSRLKGSNLQHKITHPTLPLERTFCTKCGKPYGWVSTESSQLIAAAEVIVFCEACETEMNAITPIPFKKAAPADAVDIPSLQETIKHELQVPLPRRLGE